jgi:hypothetical protein
VKSVIDEFESYTATNNIDIILKKLYVSMKLTPYKFLFGMHESGQRIKGYGTALKTVKESFTKIFSGEKKVKSSEQVQVQPVEGEVEEEVELD